MLLKTRFHTFLNISFLCLIHGFLFSAEFDCAVIGTSPVALFEALYKQASGQKVLILEAASECGGAWKSINICGLEHVDMGCHEISSSPNLNQFLETYAGVRILPSKNNSYYFSKGCFELIDHLLKRVEKAGIDVLTNCRVESVTLDPATNTAFLHTANGVFTTSKIVVTPGSSFKINQPNARTPPNPNKFYHLYLLIQDPTAPQFSYHGGVSPGVSRMMNLTSYVGLENTGRQLIVFQTHSDHRNNDHQPILDALKQKKLIDSGAYILKSETYIYEQGPYFQMAQVPSGQQNFFELINTSHFNIIGEYAKKWKTLLAPYEEILIN